MQICHLTALVALSMIMQLGRVFGKRDKHCFVSGAMLLPWWLCGLWDTWKCKAYLASKCVAILEKMFFFNVGCYVVTLMCSTVVSPRGGGKESTLILRLVLLKYLGTSVVPLFLPCINIFWGLSCKFYL